MQVREIMTERPACCSPNTSLQDIAVMMISCDCGEIPVVDTQRRPIGVVTDRDIVCRAVAQGMDPAEAQAINVMSTPVVTVTPETDLDECCRRMERNQIRRIPVVDENGCCCGVVAQADIARNAPEHETAELVKDVSQPTDSSSQAFPA